MSRTRLIIVVGAFLILAVAPTDADAVPAFARQHKLKCSVCHSFWPALNDFGRRFKEAGYTMTRGEPEGREEIEDLVLPRTFPLAAVIKSRPFDKRRGRDAQLRALQEVEVFFAGNFARYGSVYAEIEMEDEADYAPELAGMFGLHPHQLFNIIVGKASTFAADPYDTLSNMRRTTRNRRLPLNQAWSAGARIDDDVPMLAIYGRDTAVNRVFWSAAYSADVGESEGGGPKDFTGRLVVDVTNNVSVGGFVVTGAQQRTVDGVSEDLDYGRYGVDVQATYADLTALAAFLRGRDDIFGRGRENNNAWYAEFFYTIGLDSVDIPGVMLVPIVRFDWYERANGTADYSDITLNLSYLPWENTKAFIEFTRAIDRPTPGPKEWRVIGQFVLAF